MTKAIVGLYRVVDGVSKLVQQIALEESLESLTRRKSWKTAVRAEIEAAGYIVLGLNLVHSGAHPDVNIIASVDKPAPQFGAQRKKAVMRGGKQMTGPVKTGKTMAARRRSAREVPKR